MVECILAKDDVASSSLVSRSIKSLISVEIRLFILVRKRGENSTEQSFVQVRARVSGVRRSFVWSKRILRKQEPKTRLTRMSKTASSPAPIENKFYPLLAAMLIPFIFSTILAVKLGKSIFSVKISI